MVVNHKGRRMLNNLRRLISSIGIDVYLHSQDREILQKIILPYFSRRGEFQRVLFIGSDWYTRGYRRFFKNREYWTLEIDPEKRKYGSARHVVDSFANVRAHFDTDSLDLIICNGVFGFGLNSRADVDSAFQGSYECLRDGGILVHGWNDFPKARSFPPEESQGLKLFRPFIFPPLNTARYRTNSYEHIYDFYIKPPATG